MGRDGQSQDLPTTGAQANHRPDSELKSSPLGPCLEPAPPPRQLRPLKATAQGAGRAMRTLPISQAP